MIFKAYKVVSSLPDPLEPNAIYAVRVGEGFNLYVSDSTGSIAHKINSLSDTFNNYLNQSYLGDYQVGNYYTNAILAYANSTSQNTNSPSYRVDFYPFFVYRDIGIDRLAMISREATSGLLYQFSIYRDSGSTLTQVSLNYEIDASTTGLKEFSVSSLNLFSNTMYYLALNCNTFNNGALEGFVPVLFGGSARSQNITAPHMRCNRPSLMSWTYTDPLPSIVEKNSLNYSSQNTFAINYPYLLYRVSEIL